MGFFAEIASQARHAQIQQPIRRAAVPEHAQPVPEKRPAPEPEPAPPTPETPADAPETTPVHVPAPEPTGTEPVSETAPNPPEKQPAPPVIDLTPEASATDDDAGRKAHEAAEAGRKAEFDAKHFAGKNFREDNAASTKAAARAIVPP